MALQAEIDGFVASCAAMTDKVIAFIGEDAVDDTARANIRRMRAACAALQTALEQANMWASMRPPQ